MIIGILLLCFFFLLLFPQQSFEASKYGLLLWFDTLMPTLLPFLIISQLILKTSAIRLIQCIFAPLIKHVFHCSSEGAFCVLCGFLCGYPVGARLVTLALEEERIELQEAQYLISFCNNVSPAFCISYGIHYALGSPTVFPYLFFIYASPIIFGYLTGRRKSNQGIKTKKQTSNSESLFQFIDVCIIDSFLIMIRLCGYLILFSIFSECLICILPQNPYIEAFLLSILEVTTGLSRASVLQNETIRQLVAVVGLSFGGLCCLFQTYSVISSTELSLRKYLIHKIIICLFSVFLFLCWKFSIFIIYGRS